MSGAYLLPCPSCHRETRVVAGQAGQTIRCSCGTDLQVPTLRGLRDLQDAESTEESPSSSWSTRQALITLGLVVAFGSALPGAFFLWNWPARPGSNTIAITGAIDDSIDRMPLATTWLYWKHDVMGPGLIESPTAEMAWYQTLTAELRRKITLAFGCTALGLLVAVGALLFCRRQRAAPP